MPSTSFRWLLALGLLACVSAHAERLRSPWDSPAITPTDLPYDCPAPPAFTNTIDAESYYTDANHSVIDPAKKAAYERADEPLVHLGQYAGLAADAWRSRGS
ncbi:MAG: poly(beta-D-mannuronate) lyase, partial [Silvibacterium sp.]|nr:poly(beta-D-mannuronate) lyase [Silvibacterium sp.]